ncbi:MAG TPA: hypothetical protein PKE29_14390 [Phycisphaerales bacterium]|nr:hypothetical protein [Phycisphaerales bacterium]
MEPTDAEPLHGPRPPRDGTGLASEQAGAAARRDGTWGRLGMYLIGVAIGLILLATFKVMSWQSRQQQGQQVPGGPTAPQPPATGTP